ncbi:hypothetical protein PQ455_17720 [Sphingomonas naphthae]|uniref:Uncharacterized protein n=1 Tax=Sphingomonas naphthae TaxID=1813468 RepID=A0ABY7TKV7_9SPHN|nr:hypothetical protein [Sphingomonas naphthae]WCT73421.1 hypothetical protein PQ455_17720 [Sphingomonas naphthae]
MANAYIATPGFKENGVSEVDGNWDCVVESPLGEQSFTFTITTAGDRFSGHAKGTLGSIDIPDGLVTGNQLAWSMPVPKPMPLTLRCKARVDGDTLEGEVSAGIFGTFPVRGTRVA